MENKEIKNLWSENFFKFDNKDSPFFMLKQQAKYFNEMAKGILVAKVISKNVTISSIEGYNHTDFNLVQSLRIIAPKLDNYYFDIVKLYQNGLSLYPLHLDSPFFEEDEKKRRSDERFYICNDDQLLEALKEILSYSTTEKAIQNLITQSREKQ